MTTDDWFLLGFGMGCLITWLSFRKPPVVKVDLVIDAKLLDKIDLITVNAWLEKEGLCWQPKGAVFSPKKDTTQ